MIFRGSSHLLLHHYVLSHSAGKKRDLLTNPEAPLRWLSLSNVLKNRGPPASWLMPNRRCGSHHSQIQLHIKCRMHYWGDPLLLNHKDSLLAQMCCVMPHVRDCELLNIYMHVLFLCTTFPTMTFFLKTSVMVLWHVQGVLCEPVWRESYTQGRCIRQKSFISWRM